MMVWDYIHYDYMKIILYTISLLFVWVEWTQITKKNVVYKKIIDDKQHLHLFIFSLSKLMNIICVLLGLSTPFWIYYACIIFIEFLKFPILSLKNFKIINFYSLIATFTNIVIYLTIFIQGVLLLLL
jgi:hypothetical protein